MAVDRAISLANVKRELADCESDAKRFGWEISPVNEENQTFQVKMVSSVDRETYLFECRFDNYREYPLHIEFLDPLNNQPGTKNAYPACKDSFFHGKPAICNPCSRKAYGNIHGEWTMSNWEKEPKIGALKNIWAILRAISDRINDPTLYKGRMK